MLLMEEFLCQSSMERTCGQYCSSTVDGETNAWGRRSYLGWMWKTLGLLLPFSIEEGRALAQLAPGWCDTNLQKAPLEVSFREPM
jgi:hypothetical protein